MSVPDNDDNSNDNSGTETPAPLGGAVARPLEQSQSRIIHDDEFELDTINASTPCMPALLQCIDYINDKCAAEHAKHPTRMPDYMQKLRSQIMDLKHHPNVRLVIGKIVMMRSRVFAPFAQEWLEPLMLLCLRDLHDAEVSSRTAFAGPHLR